MQATGIDERRMVTERVGADFVVFFYEGNEDAPALSVDSYLLTDADLPRALAWVSDTAPAGCCWSLGVVLGHPPGIPDRDLEVAWVVGADVLNIDPDQRTDEDERVARQMLDRRDRVDLSR